MLRGLVSREPLCEELLSYRRSVVKVEMAFLDTLTVVSLRVGQTKETLLQEVTTPMSADLQDMVFLKLTLSRSRKRKQCSGVRECQRHRQYHPHPSGRLLIGHGRGRNLCGDQRCVDEFDRKKLTAPGISIGAPAVSEVFYSTGVIQCSRVIFSDCN